ncbi:RidA family protein [Kocuria oceani]|uniref:RidA family protein n=1 Tax=Kocuria oceani TaxID=988827 RepID=A0ABV9TGQ4_9MICC
MSADVTAQCETMLDNVETLLGEVGLEPKHLVRTVLYLTDYADVGALNTVHGRRLSIPYPARTTMQVAGLPLGAASPGRRRRGVPVTEPSSPHRR